MNGQWDIEVYNEEGQLALGVEVKSKTDVSPEWASRLRRNILAHGIYPDPPYFLMAFPDQFFLWSKGKTGTEGEKPHFVVDARPILEPYLRQVEMDSGSLSGQSLELIVTSWLSHLIHMGKAADEFSEVERWLKVSGLLDAISGGKLALAHEVFA